MNFFKRLFSKSKDHSDNESNEQSNTEPNLTAIYSTDYFEQRYALAPIEPEMLEGCFKMIEGYFVANTITRLEEFPLHHPKNLDLVDQEGFGFVLYCSAFQMGKTEGTLFLAMAFSDFLIQKYGFVMYTDATPEYPLRGMTLKYDQDGVVLSLYPFEYAAKVLQGNATFSELEDRLQSQLAVMPDMRNTVNQFLNREETD